LLRSLLEKATGKVGIFIKLMSSWGIGVDCLAKIIGQRATRPP